MHSYFYYARTHVVTTKQKSIDAQVYYSKDKGCRLHDFVARKRQKMLR